jgi:uncharacterized protein (DUF1501 family)
MLDLDLDYDRHVADVAARARIREPKGPSRRRFLQGLVAAGGATASGLPTWLARTAAASTPLGTTDGVLVVVTLLGGNDGLNTLAPISGTVRSQYAALRPRIAMPASSLLPVGDGTWGLHASLPLLAARYRQGTVAVVRGLGTNGDGSHFATRATMMAGTATTSRSDGWLGRYSDGLSEWDSGFREVSVGATVPLHLVGRRVEVTALPATGTLWGSDQTNPAELVCYEAVRAMAAQPTGLSPMADAAIAAVRDSVERAATVTPLYAGTLPAAGLVRDLTLAARTINANLGTRVVAVTRNGFDHHALQVADHAKLLSELDQGIDAFFAALSPAFRRRVSVLVLSEFGRRAAENSSMGTDHGAAGLAFLIGDNVLGGMYGSQPSLTSLDRSGNLVPAVDVRSVYASVLGPWLDGDPSETLGASYEDLKLFTAGPGLTPSS